MATCPGSLILHRGGNIAGCTEDDERDGCHGLELRHEGDPKECWRELDGCNVCGIHQPPELRAEHPPAAPVLGFTAR